MKKKENPLRVALRGGNADYANYVREFFSAMDNGSKAHVLVAYQNLLPLVGAMHTVAKQQSSAFSIDDFIIECSNGQEAATDEINMRRYAWFLWAAMIYRLNTMASGDTGLRDTLAEVWCDIARCAPFLKALLPDNVVWKTEEKIWFEGMIDYPKPGMVAWAINHGGPKSIWKAPAIQRLAEEYGFFYYKEGGSMGPVSYIPPRTLP